MKLLYLSASNLFGLASNAEFDFTESDLIALTGANGSGKSSLMDAVRTACFGEASPARNVSLKDYISRGSSSASVCMEFLDRDDVKLRVTRNFTVQYPSREFFRFLRLRLTGENHNGGASLRVTALEVFGVLVEK